jgi:hypothetical protein
MNAITNIPRQLVRRKLWPVAILLVAALVAVPLKLAKTPAAAAPAPAAALPQSDQAETIAKPVVQLYSSESSSADTTRRRRVLGQAKDPFEPAPLPKKKKLKKAKASAKATPTATPSSSSSAAGSGGATPAPSAPTPAPTPAGPTVPAGSIKVRFGAVTASDTSELPIVYLQRLAPLEDNATPIVVFEHLTDHGKAAVFSIPGDVTAEGDGKCDPQASVCETLTLHAHDTEFITVTGTDANGAATSTQYELDLVDILTKKTPVPADALTGSGSASTSG